ncbi:hypothetical protein [Mariniluteicoccus flavus]
MTRDPVDRVQVTPREFGRDGVSGMLDDDRAMRARDVSRPTDADVAAAELTVEAMVARAQGRR